jgi:hypothetical protein
MNRTRVLAKGYIEVQKDTHHHSVTISLLFSFIFLPFPFLSDIGSRDLEIQHWNLPHE